jgi:hypothetical protein
MLQVSISSGECELWILWYFLCLVSKVLAMNPRKSMPQPILVCGCLSKYVGRWGGKLKEVVDSVDDVAGYLWCRVDVGQESAKLVGCFDFPFVTALALI